MRTLLLLISFVLLVFTVSAAEQSGWQWGNAVFTPNASLQGAYDNRVQQNQDGTFNGDTYAEWRTGLSLKNQPAMVNYSALGSYGQRYYNELSAQNTYFYRLRGQINSGESPFIWGLWSDLNRSLDYNTTYDPDTGQRPDSILTSDLSTRSVTSGNIGYDARLSDNSSLRPSYSLLHYFQDFATANDAEWQIHNLDLQLRRKYSDRTTFVLGAGYSQQVNYDENGYVGSVRCGVEGKMSERTSWEAALGYSFADYELSGKDHGGTVDLQGNWKVSDKLSCYVFGGNEFQPGYDGGAARWLYRLGYGIGWQAVENVIFNISSLHDYQDVIGSNTSTDPNLGTLRTFVTTSLNYSFYRSLSAGLSYRYVRDEKSPDQQIVSASLNYSY